MAIDLADLIAPEHTAVVTMEVQRGVVGDLSPLAELAEAAKTAGVLRNGPALCAGARAAGAAVVHATAVRRADGRGGAVNCRMLAGSRKAQPDGGGIVEGSPGAELVPEFGPEPEDIVVPRLHGLTPFTSTSLDQILRNLGVTTIIATGVSLNIGVLGLVLGAVDLGYQVVVPPDAVAGVPVAYGESILAGSMQLLATLAPTEEILATWR